jgi:hypothetical protein
VDQGRGGTDRDCEWNRATGGWAGNAIAVAQQGKRKADLDRDADCDSDSELQAVNGG